MQKNTQTVILKSELQILKHSKMMQLLGRYTNEYPMKKAKQSLPSWLHCCIDGFVCLVKAFSRTYNHKKVLHFSICTFKLLPMSYGVPNTESLTYSNRGYLSVLLSSKVFHMTTSIVTGYRAHQHRSAGFHLQSEGDSEPKAEVNDRLQSKDFLL